jgi:hypothetical protein
MARQAPFDPPANWVNSVDTQTSHRYPDIYTEHSPAKLEDVIAINAFTHEFRSTNGFRIRIERWRPDIWRVRYTSRAFSRDFSYALAPGLEPQSETVTLTEQEDHYLLVGTQLEVQIAKADGRLRFLHQEDGEEILRDGAPYLERTSIETGTHHRRVSFAAPKEEIYYGLGRQILGPKSAGPPFSKLE